MKFATTSGHNKYETCPHNNFICNKVVSEMAEKPTKCTGLVVCYESMLTNHALDGVKYKVNTLYKIRQGKAPRICQKCVEDGKCKESSRGIKHQWNGFMVFYNMDSKAVEVGLLQSDGCPTMVFYRCFQLWRKIHCNSDIFWENFRKEGIRLEEVLGFEVLELDLGMWNEHYALMENREERNVHMWMETLENCEEVNFNN
ncbi:hypothetical protein Mgra_00007285 [Meloidogyne graminicola]|uniref:Uncharacterized protein n=1 Tax=Meloidogyne graminicola TaxID=189291 RepID=A0A8S9ZJ67_9BILA|nr:hypothetical protein Mgra_00007285 [Meloidogyne graminicola]